jgi:hypothetical protein
MVSKNIKVEIIWHANPNPINLVGTAGMMHCHLCAVEQMVIGHNFYSSRQIHLINLGVNFVEYVVVRHCSYGSYDLVRKGGSNEGEEKPENRAVVIEYGRLFFLTVSEVKIFCLVNNPGVTTKDQPVRSIVVFF